MTSYKTLVFGTIALVCAASPAIASADSIGAVPGPIHKTDSIGAVPGPVHKTDCIGAVPGPIHKHDSIGAVPKVVVTTGLPGMPTVKIDMETLVKFIVW